MDGRRKKRGKNEREKERERWYNISGKINPTRPSVLICSFYDGLDIFKLVFLSLVTYCCNVIYYHLPVIYSRLYISRYATPCATVHCGRKKSVNLHLDHLRERDSARRC